MQDNIMTYLRDDKAIFSFCNDRIRGRQAHAYLVTASDTATVDKALHLMASMLICEHNSACGSCSACNRINKDMHPDVRWYRSKDKIIKVDTVENIIADASITALESATKVLIMPTADRLNASAQNKFLKTLEEPPRDVIILLGAVNESMLLPTIRSRLKKLHVNIWNVSNITSELTARGYNADKISFATQLYPTSLDNALSLINDDKHFARYQLLLSTLLKLKSSANIVDCLGCLGAPSELADSLSLLEAIFGALVSDYGEGRNNPLMSMYNKTVAVAAIYLINDLAQRLEANISSMTIENNLLFSLLDIKYRNK